MYQIKVLFYTLPEGFQYKPPYAYPSELSPYIMSVCVYAHRKYIERFFLYK